MFKFLNSNSEMIKYFPLLFQNDAYGYVMAGDPIATSRGYQITLNRIQGGTMFGNDIDTVTLDVTFDTDSRLKIYLL